jgi:hypothetical protein
MDSLFNQELEKLLNLEMVDFPFWASFYDFALTLIPFSIKIKAPFETFSNIKVVPLVPSLLEI